MTVPCFTHDQFFAFLKSKGWDVISTEYWEEYNRLILAKGGIEMIYQCLPQGKKYFYPTVVKTCELFDEVPPDDHLHSYYQHYKKNDPCHCGSGIVFNKCHGKVSVSQEPK